MTAVVTFFIIPGIGLILAVPAVIILLVAIRGERRRQRSGD